jgi:monoamine oxidase
VRVDVVVIGAGLGGLACARDLVRAGTDVLLLEARDRPGGRVEGEVLADGRLVQVGGEVVGTVHHAYRGLADELGVALVPSYTDVPGETYYDLTDGLHRGEGWLTDDDHAALGRLTSALIAAGRGIDPSTPLRAGDAGRLDRLSVHDLARDVGATSTALRRLDLGLRYTGIGDSRTLSVLAAARTCAAVGGHSPEDYTVWENLKVDGGSSRLVDALVASIGDRIRYSAPVVAIHVGTPCRVVVDDGEVIEADAVVCGVPLMPLRAVEISGLSEERLRGLRAQRSTPVSKAVVALDSAVWETVGGNGQILSERESGGFWVQGGTVLSSLNGPEVIDRISALPEQQATRDLITGLARVVGPVGNPTVLWRHWGGDAWTLGYAPDWAPGAMLDVGPLHGRHEPPFYVAGSDHWASGYMEGAVATGRNAAAAVLGDASTHPLYPAAQ